LNKRTAGEYARLDEKDLPELLIKMENYSGDTLTRLGLRALKYTFPRPGMLTGSPWTEFDLDRARWDIPKERMKMPTPHIVPLSRQAVEVLRTLQQITGDGEYVFPGTHGNKHMDTNTLLFALYRLGYQGRMTSHGFRGIASTVLNERGFDDKHIEIQLAHLQRNKTKKAYDHAKYLEPRRNLMQWWADFLDEELAKGRKLVTAH